jgi:prepilin-type N-terminal cleavage/methylation domain-containing protein
VHKRYLLQRGDTIVEVMIVLAVLGSAISIAYATASKSLINTRQAQEASQATVLAQSQLEKLRLKSNIIDQADTDNFTYFTAPTKEFCIRTDPADNKDKVVLGDLTDANNLCNKMTEAAAGVWYSVAITHNPNPTDTFTVKIVWDDISGEGDGKDRVTLVYRVHPTL